MYIQYQIQIRKHSDPKDIRHLQFDSQLGLNGVDGKIRYVRFADSTFHVFVISLQKKVKSGRESYG